MSLCAVRLASVVSFPIAPDGRRGLRSPAVTSAPLSVRTAILNCSGSAQASPQRLLPACSPAVETATTTEAAGGVMGWNLVSEARSARRLPSGTGPACRALRRSAPPGQPLGHAGDSRIPPLPECRGDCVTWGQEAGGPIVDLQPGRQRSSLEPIGCSHFEVSPDDEGWT